MIFLLINLTLTVWGLVFVLTVCHPMDCSTPGFPVHHQLLELTQTHVYRVSDAIQPSRPLSAPSSAFFPSIRVVFFFFSPVNQFFASGGQSIGASASILPMNIQGWFPSELTGWSLYSPKDSQESSLTPQFKSINSLVLSFLYGPTLTSIHDYWKNHSFD